MLPVLVQFAELGLPFRREAVVLARRTRVRLLPLVIEQAVTPHLAQERVQRAFLRREIRRAETLQDVGRVNAVGGDDLQDQELEETPSDRGESLVDTHCLKWECYLFKTR